MKNMLAVIFLIGLLSCGKDEENTNNPGSASYISMKINGVVWKGETNFASGLFQNNFSASVANKVGDKTQVITLGYENANQCGVNTLDKNNTGTLLFVDGVNNITWSIGRGNSASSGQFKITKTK